MKFKTVSYKRIKNLGNFESATIEMCAEISSDEDPQIATHVLMDNVERVLKVGKHAPEKEGTEESDDKNPDYF